MSDPIEAAIKTAVAKSNNAAIEKATAGLNMSKDALVGKITSTVTSAIPPQAATALAAAEKLKNLPISKDPELLKKQVEAEVLTKKAQAEMLLLVGKDLAIEFGKQKLKELALKKLAAKIPKLPVIDPKILQAVALGLQAKQLWKQRKKLSKENLKRGKETYTYPLKSKGAGLPTLPKIPDLPKKPNLSEIPKVPNLPTTSTSQTIFDKNKASPEKIAATKAEIETLKSKLERYKQAALAEETAGRKGSDVWKNNAEQYVIMQDRIKLTERKLKIYETGKL